MPSFVIKTPRMILRPWRDEDYAPNAVWSGVQKSAT